MLKLRTVFPFGLNARIGDEFMDDSKDNPISPKFPKLVRQFVKGTKGNNLNKNNISAESFLAELKIILETNIKDAMNFIRVSLHSFTKEVKKKYIQPQVTSYKM